MWKKGRICGLIMLLLVLAPVVFVRAEGNLEEEMPKGRQGLDSALLNAGEFPETSAKLTITEDTYYKYTAEETVKMHLWTSGASGYPVVVDVYDGQGKKIMVLQKDRGEEGYDITDKTIYIQKGDTCYFHIHKSGEYTFAYGFSSAENASIKNVTVLQYPASFGYKEWYSYYYETCSPRYYGDDHLKYGFYDSILNDLRLQVEWENGEVTTEIYKSNSCQYYSDIQFEKEGTYTIFLCYKGKTIELPYTIKSLYDIKTDNAVLQKNIDLEYINGEWKGFTFTPLESGYYDISYSATGKFTVLLASMGQGVMINEREWEGNRYYGHSVLLTNGRFRGDYFLVEGRTYYLYAGPETVGGQLRLKIRKSGDQIKYSDVTVEKMESVSYTGSPQEPKPVILWNGVDIATKDWDKSYKYYYNQEPGIALVKIHFGYLDEDVTWNGRTVYATFIIRQPITEAEVIMPEYTYTGKAIFPEAEVRIKGQILERDKDYTIAVTDNVEAGTAMATITGIGKYEGTITRTFTIRPLQRTIEVSDTFIKNKRSKAFKLGAKSDGRLTYSSSNKKVAKVNANGKVTVKGYGTAVIRIKALGDKNHAEGQKSVKVVVTSKAGKIKSLKNSSGGKVTVKLQRVADAQGYEISYSTDKNFTQNVKKQTTKDTAIILKNLKKKTSYYVRVRSYRKVKGKKLYSDYSRMKTVAIKK